MQDEIWNLLPQDPNQNEFPTSKPDEPIEGIVTGTTYPGGEGPMPLTEAEVEKIRLLLSIYQDGSGMQALRNGLSLPGWRDFERAVAVALDGKPPLGEGKEGKNVFDVVVPIAPDKLYGISCKMKGYQGGRILTTNNRVHMELSNSAKKFWQYLKNKGINESNYRAKAAETGIALIELVSSWHHEASTSKGGITIDLNKSFYLALSWNLKGDYQLHQFSLRLPNPANLTWRFPESQSRLCGFDATDGVLFEWYGDTGGQLKYFPLSESALWKSPVFRLEPLPSSEEVEYGIAAKVKEYFPQQWAAVSSRQSIWKPNI